MLRQDLSDEYLAEDETYQSSSEQKFHYTNSNALSDSKLYEPLLPQENLNETVHVLDIKSIPINENKRSIPNEIKALSESELQILRQTVTHLLYLIRDLHSHHELYIKRKAWAHLISIIAIFIAWFVVLGKAPRNADNPFFYSSMGLLAMGLLCACSLKFSDYNTTPKIKDLSRTSRNRLLSAIEDLHIPINLEIRLNSLMDYIIQEQAQHFPSYQAYKENLGQTVVTTFKELSSQGIFAHKPALKVILDYLTDSPRLSKALG